MMSQRTEVPALKMAGLTKSFGGVVAVSGVDLSFGWSEKAAIIGPNGSGKTTLFNLLTGYHLPDAGHVELFGESLHGARPETISQAGLARTFQVPSIFGKYTALENIQGALIARDGAGRRPWGSAYRYSRKEGHEILARVGLADEPDVAADLLSYGNQRRLEIGLALALDPKVLLLDEPTAGLSPAASIQVMELVIELVKGSELTLVFIEHDMDIVSNFADRVVVMFSGRVLADGSPSEVRTNVEVREAYLGHEA